MPDYDPTPEQIRALDLFKTGRSLAIEAGAGTGKTSTLLLLAEATDRRGQYIAFNKAIVKEAAEKFPHNVACSTAHSLAYRAIVPGTRFAERLRNSRRMKSTELADALRLDSISVVSGLGEHKTLSRSFLAGLAMRGVTRFCQSADAEPEARHVPYVDGLDLPGKWDVNREVARALVPAMRRAWADLSVERGMLPFKHDHYLKMWHLSGPRIASSFILFDEAQDANPVLVDIVRQQRHSQLVWVGDSQQQIYSFTGAINALQTVGAEQTTFLTQSFRFGPAIAEVANGLLGALAAPLRLAGLSSIDSRVETVDAPDVVLCRTNAAAVRIFLDELAADRRPHLVGGGTEVVAFAKAARDLQTQGWTSHPELACFKSWGEVQEYVELDEQGGELKLLVSLVDRFTPETIITALERMPREDVADIVISTAHKSKGREWSRVRLADDFPEKSADEELRLLYVACTRAKHRLDVSAVAWFTAPAAEVEDEDVDHDDPAHDFASCPVCIAESRDAELASEEACSSEAPALHHPIASGDTLGDTLGALPRDVHDALTGASADYCLVYSGRSSDGVRVPAKIAVDHAREIYSRTGRRVVVLDSRGELVVEFCR